MRKRRGFVPFAILHLLKEEPMHGYQIMKELEERSGGAYSASAGTVYPALQELLDKNMIELDITSDRKVYSLTENGKNKLQFSKHPEGDFWDHWKKKMTWRNSPESIQLHSALDHFDKNLKKAIKKIQKSPEDAQELITLINEMSNRLNENSK